MLWQQVCLDESIKRCLVGLGFQCNEFENAKTHPLIEYQKCLTDKGLISYIAKYNKLKSGLNAERAHWIGFVNDYHLKAIYQLVEMIRLFGHLAHISRIS